MTLGEKIRKLRQEAGLSQAQLADALTVSRAAVAKWENENGTPDISNLKALSDHFGVEVDLLLDEANDLSIPGKATAIPVNPNTFCGKSCDACSYKEKLECPGCKAGPAELYHGSCEIAKCCRNYCQRSCDSCSLNAHCGMLKGAESMPQKRDKKLHQERLLKEMLQRQAPFFGKWLWILFWLVVPANVADLMNQDVFSAFPTFQLIGYLGTLACELAYALITLHLSRECDRFKTAGICQLLRAGCSILIYIVGSSGWSLLISIPAAVLSLVGIYNEYIGYSEILMRFHDDLSAKWDTLWKAHKWLLCGLIGSILLLVILQLIGALVLLLCAIGLVVVSIIKLVYLYQTAKFFREVL